MFIEAVIRKNQYYDSVFLMGINNRLMKIPGVLQTAVLMGSDANKQILLDLGFQNPEVNSASANDLVVAVKAETTTARDAVLQHLDEWLTEVSSKKAAAQVHDLREALAQKPDANLVVISVPGEYAAHEAQMSLEAGRNVFLFSDNVSVEDEVALKRFASEHGLLVMGPDCGTSILGGVGIAFSNAVRKGNIGAIAAAGTGLQEFTSMVHNAGHGISHAIGTGGRDLSEPVGGITTLTALDALEKDPRTEVIVILSKPPAARTLSKLIERFRSCKKPIIGCFLGIPGKIDGEGVLFQKANLIDDAVKLANESIAKTESPMTLSEGRIPVVRPNWSPEQKYLRGVFAGGTFTYQSQQIFRNAGIRVFSNTPIDKANKLGHPDQSQENSIVDMGEEFYMVGRPHPMIDGSQRSARILKEAQDPQMAILLLDFILGYNASMDPVGDLIESISKAREITRRRGGELAVVASICGTDADPQDLRMQKRMLEENGVTVFQSNARATEYCLQLLKEVDHV